MVYRSVAWLLLIIAATTIFYFGRGLLAPLLFALLLAQALSPLVRRLEKVLPRPIAPLVALALVGVGVALLANVISEQLAALQTEVPHLEQRVRELAGSFQDVIQHHLNIPAGRREALTRKSLEDTVAASGQVAVAAVGFGMAALGMIAVVAVYAYFLLYYRAHFLSHLRTFLERFSANGTETMLERVGTLAQKYVSSFILVMALIGGLDTLGFLAAGAPFPLLLGLMGALAIAIPYVGILLVAPAACVLTWVATGSTSTTATVLAVYGVVHFLEGNLITPHLVGQQVNLNPLASILAVVLGGELWGIPGMLLFIPVAGMLQIALDASPATKPLARMLGTVPAPPTPRRMRVEQASRSVASRIAAALHLTPRTP